jgi:hypothetical protein
VCHFNEAPCPPLTLSHGASIMLVDCAPAPVVASDVSPSSASHTFANLGIAGGDWVAVGVKTHRQPLITCGHCGSMTAAD